MNNRTKAPGAKSNGLHPRNLHQGRYNLTELCAVCTDLKQYLRSNPSGEPTIDFADEQAVRCLNRALLVHYYGVEHWMIPAGYLCPPIPGRADYIHYLADLLAGSDGIDALKAKPIRVLDIGTGANCIYPIIGTQRYGWKFVGTDVDTVAVKSARAIVELNPCLNGRIRIVQQKKRGTIFRGVIKASDHFDLTMCNPPFHASQAEAETGSQRKLNNLSKGARKEGSVKLNFGGQSVELWCPGGELAFVSQMARESVEFAKQVTWFSCLISKSEHLQAIKSLLAKLGAKQIEVVNMSQGQKKSRFIAWSFIA